MPLWVIPLLYVAGTLVFGIGFARLNMRTWPGKLTCCLGGDLTNCRSARHKRALPQLPPG